MDGEENEPEEGKFRPDQTMVFMATKPTTEAQINFGKTMPAPVGDFHADELLGATLDPTVNVFAPPKVLETVEIHDSIAPVSQSLQLPSFPLWTLIHLLGLRKLRSLGQLKIWSPLGALGHYQQIMALLHSRLLLRRLKKMNSYLIVIQMFVYV